MKHIFMSAENIWQQINHDVFWCHLESIFIPGNIKLDYIIDLQFNEGYDQIMWDKTKVSNSIESLPIGH